MGCLNRGVVVLGTTCGRALGKFSKFDLTTRPARQVLPPLINESYASLEWRVSDVRMVTRHNFFVLEVLKAWINPAYKQLVHCIFLARGGLLSMVKRLHCLRK